MLPTSAGVEPATSWSPVRRRIQLSHRGRHQNHLTFWSADPSKSIGKQCRPRSNVCLFLLWLYVGFNNLSVIVQQYLPVAGSSMLTPASILYKSIAGRYRPVSYPDGPITARYRFIKNAYWDFYCCLIETSCPRHLTWWSLWYDLVGDQTYTTNWATVPVPRSDQGSSCLRNLGRSDFSLQTKQGEVL